ncbi:MAG: glycosyltransferase [bacterium]
MKTRITVLHIIHTLELGGAEKFLLSVARSTKDIVNVKICSMYGHDHLTKAFETENITTIRLNRKNKFNPLIILELSKIIKSVQPDMIHTHLFFATIYGRIAAKMSGVPVITTEHNESNWRSGNIIAKIAYKLTAWNNTRIIAISEAVKSALVQDVKIQTSQIAVINNGISLSEFTESKQNSRVFRADFVVGSVGRLDVRKGYDVLLQAVAHLKSNNFKIKCILVGDGKERDQLQLLAKKLGIKDDVIFAGFQFEIQSYLAGMDVFVLPSKTEGFGIAILEAMAAGCPVVASNVGGIPEIIKPGVNGLLVNPDDAEQLASAILKLQDRQLAQKIIANSKNTVSEFSIEKHIPKLMAEYQKLLN